MRLWWLPSRFGSPIISRSRFPTHNVRLGLSPLTSQQCSVPLTPITRIYREIHISHQKKLSTRTPDFHYGTGRRHKTKRGNPHPEIPVVCIGTLTHRLIAHSSPCLIPNTGNYRRRLVISNNPMITDPNMTRLDGSGILVTRKPMRIPSKVASKEP